MFEYVDDPRLFEFNEAMRDFKDPDDIEVKPVPEDYPVEEEIKEKKKKNNIIDEVEDDYSIKDNKRTI